MGRCAEEKSHWRRRHLVQSLNCKDRTGSTQCGSSNGARYTPQRGAVPTAGAPSSTSVTRPSTATNIRRQTTRPSRIRLSSRTSPFNSPMAGKATRNSGPSYPPRPWHVLPFFASSPDNISASRLPRDPIPIWLKRPSPYSMPSSTLDSTQIEEVMSGARVCEAPT